MDQININEERKTFTVICKVETKDNGQGKMVAFIVLRYDKDLRNVKNPTSGVL